MGKLLERNANKKPRAIPELRDGDMLDTKEFLRRYEAMPVGTRAELLGGVVWLNRWVEVLGNGRTRIIPPLSGGHSIPQTDIVTLFKWFAGETDGVLACGPRTVVLNGVDSACEPDGLLYLAAYAAARRPPANTITCRARLNSFSKSPNQPLPKTSEPNATITKNTASRNTSSGRSMLKPSAGSPASKGNTSCSTPAA